MKEDLTNNDLVDALNCAFFDIECLFDTLTNINQDEIRGYLVNDLGYLGKSLLQNAKDGVGKFCEIISETIGEMGVLRRDFHYRDLREIEGLDIKFSNIMKGISEQEEFPPHVEIIKQFDLGRREYIYRVNKKPPSLAQREEGEVDLHHEIAQG